MKYIFRTFNEYTIHVEVFSNGELEERVITSMKPLNLSEVEAELCKRFPEMESYKLTGQTTKQKKYRITTEDFLANAEEVI